MFANVLQHGVEIFNRHDLAYAIARNVYDQHLSIVRGEGELEKAVLITYPLFLSYRNVGGKHFESHCEIRVSDPPAYQNVRTVFLGSREVRPNKVTAKANDREQSEQSTYQRALIDSWRKMIAEEHQRYEQDPKGDSTPSFCELIEARAEYLSLRPRLSPDTLEALKKDKFPDTVRIVAGGRGSHKMFVNPVDHLIVMLSDEIARIETGWGLLPIIGTQPERPLLPHNNVTSELAIKIQQVYVESVCIFPEDDKIGFEITIQLSLLNISETPKFVEADECTLRVATSKAEYLGKRMSCKNTVYQERKKVPMEKTLDAYELERRQYTKDTPGIDKWLRFRVDRLRLVDLEEGSKTFAALEVLKIELMVNDILGHPYLVAGYPPWVTKGILLPAW